MFRKIAEGDVFAVSKEFGKASGSRTVVLPDDSLLVTLWYTDGETNGIRYVRLVRE